MKKKKCIAGILAVAIVCFFVLSVGFHTDAVVSGHVFDSEKEQYKKFEKKIKSWLKKTGYLLS